MAFRPNSKSHSAQWIDYNTNIKKNRPKSKPPFKAWETFVHFFLFFISDQPGLVSHQQPAQLAQHQLLTTTTATTYPPSCLCPLTGLTPSHTQLTIKQRSPYHLWQQSMATWHHLHKEFENKRWNFFVNHFLNDKSYHTGQQGDQKREKKITFWKKLLYFCSMN